LPCFCLAERHYTAAQRPQTLQNIQNTQNTQQKEAKTSKTKNRLLSRLETLLPNALKLVALVSENEFLPVTGDNFSKVPYLLAFARYMHWGTDF
jgi:hypothetical protein